MPMARPREAISLALEAALRARGPSTWKELAAAAQVGRTAAKHAMRNMVAAGRAEVVDKRRHAACNQPLNVYQACDPAAQASSDATLDDAMRRLAMPLRPLAASD